MVSLDVAKQLKAAGWPQERPFSGYKAVSETEWRYTSGFEYADALRKGRAYAAPYLEELLEALPREIEHEGCIWWLTMQPSAKDEDWGFCYKCNESDYPTGLMWDTNPADTAGLLWIWCKENGHIDEVTDGRG